MSHGHDALVFGCDECIAERDTANGQIALGLRPDGSMVCPACGSVVHQRQQWGVAGAKYRRTCHDCGWTTGWVEAPA